MTYSPPLPQVLYHFQPDQRLWTRVLGSILNEPQNFFIMNSAVASHNGSLYILLFMCEEVVRVVRVQRFDTATGTWEIVSTKPIPVQNSAMLLTSYYIKSALGEGASAAVEWVGVRAIWELYLPMLLQCVRAIPKTGLVVRELHLLYTENIRRKWDCVNEIITANCVHKKDWEYYIRAIANLYCCSEWPTC